VKLERRRGNIRNYKEIGGIMRSRPRIRKKENRGKEKRERVYETVTSKAALITNTILYKDRFLPENLSMKDLEGLNHTTAYT
jgi:hypothetical protein